MYTGRAVSLHLSHPMLLVYLSMICIESVKFVLKSVYFLHPSYTSPVFAIHYLHYFTHTLHIKTLYTYSNIQVTDYNVIIYVTYWTGCMKSLHHQSTCIYMYIALYLIISVDLCNIMGRMYEKPASSKYVYIHVHSAISNNLCRPM